MADDVSHVASENVSDAVATRYRETVVCGMAIGYTDSQAMENSLITEQAPAVQNVLLGD